MTTLDKASRAAAVVAFGVALSACGTPVSPGAQSTVSQSDARPGTGSRAQNQKLGVSYVAPQGFKEAATRDIPGLVVATFVLGEPDPSKIATQFTLTKLQGPDDYAPGTSADMDNAALLDAFVKTTGAGPGDTVEGEPERSQWQGELPGASALVKVEAEGTGETGEYEAFLGSGERRWSVRGMFTAFPPGASAESLKTQLDEFAKSVRPL
ncbi:MAG: hypothetical protein ACRC20_05345 [Segniliparus sp.]|uniref:hypothetical protein n=1 Tax=Segniliparus sp. TaxID=2804064 RepID=UPI003F35C857